MSDLQDKLQEELLTLSSLEWEPATIEDPEKLKKIGLHNPRYTLYKVLSSSKKAQKKRRSSGRGGPKTTQILEEKVGPERREVERLISQSSMASQYEYKELTPNQFQGYTQRLLRYYAEGEIDFFVCDLETQHTEWFHPKGDVIGFALSDPKERIGYFVGLSHPDLDRTPEEQEVVRRCAKKLWRRIPIVNHNVTFDLHWMAHHLGVQPADVTVKADTMFQCSVIIGRDRLNPGEKMSLKHMAKRVLGWDLPWGDLVDEALSSIRLKINRVFFNLKYDLISIYACFDGIATLLLYEEMAKQSQEDELDFVNQKMSEAVVPFTEIEQFGIGLDEALRQQLLQDYMGKMERIKEAFTHLPMVQEFNKDHPRPCLISSHDDLRELFFTPKYYCIHPIAYTDTGLASTSEDVLSEIAETPKEDFREARKAAELVLRYRSVSKLESTYVSPLPRQTRKSISPSQEEEIYIFVPDYNLIGARTGRISSYFHTIPRGNDIKRMFISQFREQGGLLLNGDYSQLEVRVIAGLSKDEKLKEAYVQGRDIHRYVASQIYEKPMGKISGEERSYAKTIVFGILYGKTVHSLAGELGIEKESAQELLDFFFVGFPRVKEWVDAQHDFVKRHGYVVTPWGRRRYIPWIESSDTWKYGKALRMSQNTPIQGMASDICLDTTSRMQRELTSRGMLSNVIGTVHDSIENDAHPLELGQMIKLFRHHAVDHCNTHREFDFMNGVPLEFDFDIGVSWGGVVEIQEYIEDDHWKMSGFEKDIEDLKAQLTKNYSIVTTDFKKSEADKDEIFRTIDPGDKYSFELKVNGLY